MQKGIAVALFLPQIRHIYTLIIICKVCSIVLTTVRVHMFLQFLLPKVFDCIIAKSMVNVKEKRIVLKEVNKTFTIA